MDKGFIKMKRSNAANDLALTNPIAFALLAIIAQRARNSIDGLNPLNLKEGEAFIGDYKKMGITEQQYRTVKINLQKWGFVSFRGTNKGTVATLNNTEIFDINFDINTTDKQRTNNGQNNDQLNTQNNGQKTVLERLNTSLNNNIPTDKTTDKQRTKQRILNEKATTNKEIRNNKKEKKINKKKKQKEQQEITPLQIPTFINSTLWSDFVKMRKDLRKPLTESIIKYSIKRLEEFEKTRPGGANDSLKNSLANGYTGLFETLPRNVTKANLDVQHKAERDKLTEYYRKIQNF